MIGTMDDLHAHGARTAWLAGRLARRLGLQPQLAREIEAAAGTHDVGKAFVEPRVLDKPGRLDNLERRHVEMHAVFGAWQLMARQPAGGQRADLAVQVALLHHEWWNGLGYPFGLQGTEIPLAARIVAVADVFDALASARSYKPAWPQREVLRYVARQRGRQFDPACANAMLDMAQALPADWQPIALAEGCTVPMPEAAPAMLAAGPSLSQLKMIVAA